MVYTDEIDKSFCQGKINKLNELEKEIVDFFLKENARRGKLSIDLRSCRALLYHRFKILDQDCSAILSRIAKKGFLKKIPGNRVIFINCYGGLDYE